MKKKNFNPLKPLQYPFADDAFMAQNRMHWIPNEINLSRDIMQYKDLDRYEKGIIKNIFRFFTQSDVEVGHAYTAYATAEELPIEVDLMLKVFGATEAIHVKAYSYLIESLNFDDSIYTDFFDEPSLSIKYNIMQSLLDVLNNPISTKEEKLDASLYFTILIEGCSLFGMFVGLLYYQSKLGLMQGIGQIITYSMRDEDLHVESMSKFFVYVSNITYEDILRFKERFEPHFTFEDNVIDYFYESTVDRSAEIKEHIRYLFYERINFIILLLSQRDEKEYEIFKNNFKHVSWVIEAQGAENVNNFHVQNTQYTKLNNNDLNIGEVQW